jgi:hypothetical protein
MVDIIHSHFLVHCAYYSQEAHKMYIQVLTGWRYRPGERSKVLADVEQGRADNDGVSPLRPPLPGLIARMFGTDPDDPQTGVAVWVWESEEAANAYKWDATPESRAKIEQTLDVSHAITEGFEGIYFAHR